MAGTDILINSIFRALNLDPEKVKADFGDKVKNFEGSFNLLCLNMQQINQRLARIENELGIENDASADRSQLGHNQATDTSSHPGNANG